MHFTAIALPAFAAMILAAPQLITGATVVWATTT
jgi:hypothetical protein